MTIFEAPEYDARKARRRKIIISAVVVSVLVLGVVAWLFRNWPEERVASKFFTALVAKDYKTAYGIWVADPDWEKKQPLARYPFNEFYRDWGPAGEWGPITSFHIDGSSRPSDRNTSSNGVVVVVTINQRKEPATIFVDKKDHSISFSPFEVVQ
ncbi:MAG TPA: hypothetical protein VN577_05445 [Terriglobales bacterium]|nr:hypothetical protein [Terriglobales bacterium]